MAIAALGGDEDRQIAMADELLAGHDLRIEAGGAAGLAGIRRRADQVGDGADIALAQFARALALDELLDIGVVLPDRDGQILVGRPLRVDCFPDKAPQLIHWNGIPDSVSCVQ
ncbi:hypothetical protein D3C80_1838850 [compost metagenome]